VLAVLGSLGLSAYAIAEDGGLEKPLVRMLRQLG
jgi:hypothetical protein